MKKSERGSAAVETALVFPIILMLTIGLMEYGKYFYDAFRYQQAVYSGARVGAIAEENKEAVAKEEIERLFVNMGVDASKVLPYVLVNVNVPTGVANKSAISVRILKPYNPIIGFDRIVMPANIDISASELNY